MTQHVTCPRCDGDGEEPGAPSSWRERIVCSLCEGVGLVDTEKASEYEEEVAL